MLPLEYRKEFNDAGYKCVKAYRKRDVERTSWEKHGGPNGLKAACVSYFFFNFFAEKAHAP